MNKEEELTDILRKVECGQLDSTVAFDRILRLFSVVGRSEQLKCQICKSENIRVHNLKTLKCFDCGSKWAF